MERVSATGLETGHMTSIDLVHFSSDRPRYIFGCLGVFCGLQYLSLICPGNLLWPTVAFLVVSIACNGSWAPS